MIRIRPTITESPTKQIPFILQKVPPIFVARSKKQNSYSFFPQPPDRHRVNKSQLKNNIDSFFLVS